jgi:hypothetical protein
MIPSITAILQRFTTEWTTLLQPEAILAVVARSALPGGASACSHR